MCSYRNSAARKGIHSHVPYLLCFVLMTGNCTKLVALAVMPTPVNGPVNGIMSVQMILLRTSKRMPLANVGSTWSSTMGSCLAG